MMQEAGGPRLPLRRGRYVLAALAVLAASAGHAQGTRPAPAMPAPQAVPEFAIRGFKVMGANPLDDGETARILAPYLRANATMETLQQATSTLEKALRDRGFGLHRVALPPQEVGETVTLEIVTFTISKVRIEGASLYDEGNIRRALPELQEGRTPNFKTLAVQSAIANENPNRQLLLSIRESDEPDRIDASIAVKEQKPLSFGLGLSNAGNKSSGRDRVTLTAGHSNLFNRDHQFLGAYTTSLERTSDVRQLGLQYKVPLYAMGSVLGASYTRSDVVGNFGAFTSTGAGHTLGLTYSLYLPPDGGRRSYVTLGLEDKVFDAALLNGMPQPGVMDRRSRPLTLGYAARGESDTGLWTYNVDLAANVAGGANNDLASYQSEDPRITTHRWKALRGGASYSAPLGKWIWGVRAQGQASGDALISGEQFGLGGLGSIRGTSLDRPIAGDKGLAASAEITSPELVEGLRVLGFVDAGWLGNNNATPSKPASDRLASAGLGLRYAAGSFSLAADYGRLLNTSKVPLAVNQAAPQKGDDKLYLNLFYRF